MLATTSTVPGPDGAWVVVRHVGAEPDGFDPGPVTEEQEVFARELFLAQLADDLAEAGADDVLGNEHAWPSDLEPLDDDDLVLGLSGPGGSLELAVLASVDPRDLVTGRARVAYLRAVDRLAARVAALRASALVAIAGSLPSGDYQVETAIEHEVAVATRSSRYAAGRGVETARALAATFSGFGDALAEGEVSEAHCRALVERTRPVADDGVLAAIERRTLPKARRLPVGAFLREVDRAIADLDPDASTRHARARADRGVRTRPLGHGLGFLGLVHDQAVISAIAETLDADATALQADRGGSGAVREGDDEARLDTCRADALAARVLGSVGDDGAVAWEPRESVQVNLDLVIDLQTLRGEADRMALLDGEPVPADLGRDWVAAARTWRRVVTDPVTGHVLDYGTRQYLPEALRRYVLARDGGCTAPDCTVRSPRRLQMDHIVPFPSGPSSAENCDTKCIRCHQLKTEGRVTTTTDVDGSRTWTTPFGQSVRIPPRPFLHDPHDPVPPPRASQPPPLPPVLPVVPVRREQPRPRPGADDPPF